jgi:hypothetical protein
MDSDKGLVHSSQGRVVPCPRCHEACGWCSDYRFMHGQMNLPGIRRKCTIEAMRPDPVCAMCGGDRRVVATVRYERLKATPASANGYEGAAEVQQIPREPV